VYVGKTEKNEGTFEALTDGTVDRNYPKGKCDFNRTGICTN
jgi:hypothetical protein